MADDRKTPKITFGMVIQIKGKEYIRKDGKNPSKNLTVQNFFTPRGALKWKTQNEADVTLLQAQKTGGKIELVG